MNQANKIQKIDPLWSIVEKQYELIKMCGEGMYGQVVKARSRSSGQMVAIKLIKNFLGNRDVLRRLIGEVQILRQLSAMKNNQHTIKLLDIISDPCLEKDYVFLVTCYIESDVKKVMISSRDISFTEEHVKVILYNILCSLNFVHSANVMHRDLKPANILLDGECQVRLCDFGFSRTVPSQWSPL